MIWVFLTFLIIFWSVCIYDLINTPPRSEDFTNEVEDYDDEQYFSTRKNED